MLVLVSGGVNEKEKKRGLKNDGEECRLDFVELVSPFE